MSTISFTIGVQALDFNPLTRGKIRVQFNDGANSHNLDENLILGTPYTKQFKEVAWVSGQNNNSTQALNYASSFNRDYKSVGGFKNLGAKVIGNTVTITAKKGTFNLVSYDGNVIVVGSGVIENSTQATTINFSVLAGAGGNCDTINYNALLNNGGVAPYVLKNGNTIINAAWDGTVENLVLNRGEIATITVADSDGQEVSRSVIVPRKLNIGEFKERKIQYENSADITVESVNPVNGTTPIEYALTDIRDVVGSNYQSSNTFPSVLVGQYKLWVKDKFGCEINRIINVTELQDVTDQEITPFFLIPEANALIYSKDVDFVGEVRKNYFNTTTNNELTIGTRHQIQQNWLQDSKIQQRILSSYPFHIVTMLNCDGSRVNIPILNVQTNLGAKEKVDCVLFDKNGVACVAFQLGNKYDPDTTTVIDNSIYNGYTPYWAEIGQLVFIEGLGAKYIIGSGYDDFYGYYFTIEGIVSGATVSKIQTTYNRQIYNLFDYLIDFSRCTGSCKIRVEYGYSFNNIVGSETSEIQCVINDSDEWHLVKWNSYKNIGDMVYQNLDDQYLYLKGKFDNIYPTESETSRGDSKTYSLNMEDYLGFSFKTGAISRKLANKLNIASGTGQFTVNGVQLVRTNAPAIEDYGTTNLKGWSCDFDYGGDLLGQHINNEDVLSVSTGVVGGGNTAKTSFPSLGDALVFDGKIRYINELGEFVMIDGAFLSVN